MRYKQKTLAGLLPSTIIPEKPKLDRFIRKVKNPSRCVAALRAIEILEDIATKPIIMIDRNLDNKIDDATIGNRAGERWTLHSECRWYARTSR